MPRKQREKSKSGYYHIIIRGNERKNIFHDEEDKLRLLEIIYEKKQDNRFFMHAFCLMDNHVHLILSEGIEDVAQVMKRITVSYVYYFNKKYKRIGHLFQDRYKSEVVEQDNYILTLARYIHQNPVKAGIVKKASDYEWSSYNYYLNKSSYFSKILDIDLIMGLFSENIKIAEKQFEKYMNEEAKETFIDIVQEKEVMDEKEARELFQKMLSEKEMKYNSEMKINISNDFIKEFKEKTNLSTRKIAAITGMNKDRINKIIRS